jgi:glucose/arabinose dehydrogenase
VALDPEFGQNRRIYWSYAEPGEGGNSTAVARGTLAEDLSAVTDVEVIFSQQPKVESIRHYGSRLVFDAAGDLFITLGERSDEEFRGQAQELGSHLGKIVRLHPDGAGAGGQPVPADGRGAAGDLVVWAPQHPGRGDQPANGRIVEIEHGPRGGDELNIRRRARTTAGRSYRSG